MSKAKGGVNYDLIENIREYVTKMLSMVQGVKGLILDAATSQILSVVYTQSEILKQDVLLTEMLAGKDDKNREKLPGVRAVIFCRCTPKTMKRIQKELQRARFKDYTLIFTNDVDTNLLEELASFDKKELVCQVHEFYADFKAIDRHLFELDVKSVVPLLKSPDDDQKRYNRIVDGVMGCLLSIKKHCHIRYQGNSDLCASIARSVREKIFEEDVYRMVTSRRSINQKPVPVNLLIMDRRDDPITPLLSQFTYQAMLHQLLGKKSGGIVNNRLQLDGDKEDSKGLPTDVILSAVHDDFFRANMFNNWGDLCFNIKTMVDEYKSKMNVRGEIQSVDDIRNFINNYPQFKKFANQVDKHVSLVHKLKDVIKDHHLMEACKLEQEMCCNGHHPNDHFEALAHLLPDLRKSDKLRMALIYTIRYEGHKKVKKLFNLLVQEHNFSPMHIDLIKASLDYAGNKIRNPGLFSEGSNFFGSLKRSIGLSDVENVFTQHKPLLHKLIEQTFQNKLSSKTHPFCGKEYKSPPQNLIVFVVGGVTYEESLFVHQWNQKHPKRQVLLGSTRILNTRSFVEELNNFQKDQSYDDLM